jgi:GGDEF domain-containing protein
MPQATPTHVVERLLTLAVLEPTIGCRQYADRLGDQGFSIAVPGISVEQSKILCSACQSKYYSDRRSRHLVTQSISKGESVEPIIVAISVQVDGRCQPGDSLQ